MEIPLTVFAVKKNTDYYLRIRVCQKYETNYAPAGHEIAMKQFDLGIRQDELEVRIPQEELEVT